MKKIILSKGRHRDITTHRLLKKYIILVPESEYQAYTNVLTHEVTQSHIHKIPDAIQGLGAIRNWVLDQYEDDVIMLDDDITAFTSVTRKKGYKITNPQVCEEILANTYINARDAGVRVFGFNQTQADVRKYHSAEPFKLNTWTGTIIGIIGKDLKLDERNKLRVDADYCLQSLMKDRIVWIDQRFGFICTRDTNKGGNAFLRSKKSLDREKDYLKRKWGAHINMRKATQREGLSLRVVRKDPDIRFT